MNKFDLGAALITYLGFLVALTMREAAQAMVAKALGDRSEQTKSRATVNPIPHIDPWGTVVIPLLLLSSGTQFLFGWGKPVNPDTRYFKRIRRDVNLVFAAGPAFNFGIAIICGLIIRFGGLSSVGLLRSDDPAPRMVFSIAVANIVIGVLNLLPFPNTDGWKILLNSVNYNLAQTLQKYSMPIMIGAIALLFLGGFTPIFSFALGIFMSVFA